jgi:hypothetical protein
VIDELNLSLKRMLAGEAVPASELARATINFAAPKEEWQRQQRNLVLNCYLFRLQEDRARRSNARTLTRHLDGTSSLELEPPRLECAYVITAWNFAQQLGNEEREQQEHRLLGQTLLVLWRNPTLPLKYLSAALAATQPLELPMIAAESNELGGGDSDFWSGLGTYLRPSVTCKVTMSVDLAQSVSGVLVTSARMSVGEDMYLIGGTVSDGTRPIANAWVRLDGGNRVFTTDAEGHFRIDRIQPGNHTLVVRSVGFKDASRAVQVPQPDGQYDVILTPL